MDSGFAFVKCRKCGARVRKARWNTGRDYCTKPECISACAVVRTYVAVGVAKSIPQILPVNDVNPTVAKSGHRRA